MAQVQTFHIEAGATFAQELVYTDDDGELFDLEGYTATLQLRENIADEEPAIDMDLDIDVETATLSFTISATESSTLTAPRYFYAIELYAPDETVTRLLDGSFKVSPEVVR
jgi:hypothetical protein